MIKKFTLIMLSFGLVFFIAACGSKESEVKSAMGTGDIAEASSKNQDENFPTFAAFVKSIQDLPEESGSPMTLDDVKTASKITKQEIDGLEAVKAEIEALSEPTVEDLNAIIDKFLEKEAQEIADMITFIMTGNKPASESALFDMLESYHDDFAVAFVTFIAENPEYDLQTEQVYLIQYMMDKYRIKDGEAAEATNFLARVDELLAGHKELQKSIDDFIHASEPASQEKADPAVEAELVNSVVIMPAVWLGLKLGTMLVGTYILVDASSQM